MHKITSKEFELKDFSCEHLDFWSLDLLNDTIYLLNKYRDNYLNGNNKLEKEGYTQKDYWWQLIQLLPSSYNQKATITMNYSVARDIIHQRKNHKLDEWHQFIDALRELPYSNELLFYNN